MPSRPRGREDTHISASTAVPGPVPPVPGPIPSIPGSVTRSITAVVAASAQEVRPPVSVTVVAAAMVTASVSLDLGHGSVLANFDVDIGSGDGQRGERGSDEGVFHDGSVVLEDVCLGSR